MITEEYATLSEANEYFDPENKPYALDWFSAGEEGSAAYMYCNTVESTDMPLIITAVTEGAEGNLINVRLEPAEFGEMVSVIGRSIIVEYGEDADHDDVIAQIAANANAAALVVAESAGDGTELIAQTPKTYLYGGVDPVPSRLGLRLPLLREATRKINMLPFGGRKVDSEQTNAFPREFYNPVTEKWEGDGEVPLVVKMACCEEALVMLKYGDTRRARLRQDGVRSFSMGKDGLHEELVGKDPDSMWSSIAVTLLRGYFLDHAVII